MAAMAVFADILGYKCITKVNTVWYRISFFLLRFIVEALKIYLVICLVTGRDMFWKVYKNSEEDKLKNELVGYLSINVVATTLIFTWLMYLMYKTMAVRVNLARDSINLNA